MKTLPDIFYLHMMMRSWHTRLTNLFFNLNLSVFGHAITVEAAETTVRLAGLKSSHCYILPTLMVA